MLIPSAVWVALTSAGVSVRQVNAQDVELTPLDDLAVTADEESWVVEVKTWDRTLTPSIIHTVATRTPHRRILAIAPTISPAARAAAHQHGWSVVATSPHRASGPTGVLLRPDGRPINLGLQGPGESGAGVPEAPPVGRRKGRPGYGRDHVARLLLAGRPLTQSELADATGLSQPRISQAIHQLRTAGLIQELTPSLRTRPARWMPVSWDGLLDHWLGGYRGPGGTRTFWYGLDEANASAAKVLEQLRTQQDGEPEGQHRPHGPVLSGPVAADRFAHWARPSVAIIYSPVGADLQLAGLTPAAPHESTVHLVVPADPGVWMVPQAWPELAEQPIADPTQILWDLLHTTHTPDADQAAQHLRAFLAGITANRTTVARW